MDDVGSGALGVTKMRKATFKAVLTVRHIGFPEDTLKFEHARRFASKDECRAALPAILRRAQTLAPCGYSIDVGVMEKRRTVAAHN
jgi:hypothetical protein